MAVAGAMPAAHAQPALVASNASAPLVVGAAAAPMLRLGQEIPLRTLIELTTLKKGLEVGHRVPLEVAEPIMLGGQVVIPAGTPAMGEITMVRNKGMWGKSGAFAGRVLWLRVGDRQIRMTGTFDDKGSAGGGAAVATSALVFLPAGFFMTGTSAQMRLGSAVKAFLDEDVPVQLAVVNPQPLQAVLPVAAQTPVAIQTPVAAQMPMAAQAPAARLTPAAVVLTKN